MEGSDGSSITLLPRDWLGKAEDPSKAFCKACRSEFIADATSLKRHRLSKVHRERMTQMEAPATAPPTASTSTRPKDQLVIRAEIKLATSFAEHNIAMNIADHLIDLLKNIFTEPHILQNMTLKRSKATAVIKEVGKVVQQEIVDTLKTAKFSLIIDETTDVSTYKTYAVVVRYYDPNAECIQTKLLELLDMYDRSIVAASDGSTGQHLFDLIERLLHDNGIPIENLIGFASDGANTNMGDFNSLTSRLKIAAPGITIFRCIFRSIHLCASNAAKKLPRSCEDLLREIYSYFSHNAKRKSHLAEFQIFCETDPHKMLHVAQTCWLSLHSAVARVLEQWQPLTLYFTERYLEDRLTSSKNIYDGLKDPSLHLYFTFLDFILPKFDKFNLLFLEKDPMIHLLYDECQTVYLEVLECYYDPDVIGNTDISEIDPSEERKFIPLEHIYLGTKVHGLLQIQEIRVNVAMVNDVRRRCRQFMITSCMEMKNRFPLSSKLLKYCSIFSVSNCLSTDVSMRTPTLYDLVKEVPRIMNEVDVQNLDDEWRRLSRTKIPEELRVTRNPEAFFIGLSKLRKNDEILFTLLPQFVLNILTLPCSNADAERIFSKLNLTKIKLRNKLLTSTQANIVRVSEAAKCQGGCVKFEPTEDMIMALLKVDNKDVRDEDIEEEELL